jgi:hypothetical protein
MWFKEIIIAVYTQNNMKPINNTLYGKNADLQNVKVSGMYIYHLPLKVKGIPQIEGLWRTSRRGD